MPDRPLYEIGLGTPQRAVIYAISFLPLVGLVIGASYWSRRNHATRQFGRQLFMFALLLHVLYTFLLCTFAAGWLLSR